MYILSPAEIAKTDKATIKKNNITSDILMEYAAKKCFNWIANHLRSYKGVFHIFCGIGNNGGDGLVIARYLIKNSCNVKIYVVHFSEKKSNEFLLNFNRLKEIRADIIDIHKGSDFPKISQNEIVIDAIFGIGLSRTPDLISKKIIQHINNSKAYTLSIDIPSGLFCDRPVLDCDSVIRANHILTFQAPKLAFLLPENKEFIKTWEIIDIGLDENFIEKLQPKKQFITAKFIHNIYKPRNSWAHKGNFGHSLIIGGSFGKIGAVTLSTKAALKIGSGLVTAYVPKCGYAILQTTVPEAMVEVDNDTQLSYFNYKTKASVIGIGPGMGASENTAKGLEQFLKENNLPLVLDADAINLLAKNKKLLILLPENSVLTPHPKELERLIGKWENDYEKLKKVTDFSKKYKIIIVIKGRYTAVVKDSFIYFNSTGNAALATAGSGDVLTGMITGLIAQGYKPENATILAVFLHGKTADIAIKKMGTETFTATDIILNIGKAFIDTIKD